jgi:hypothetical protein
LRTLLSYCNQSYNRPEVCDDCQNPCPETGNCETCLETIHFGTEERQYNCTNILYFYVCKYIFKYSSEIAYLINSNAFKCITEFNILSLGCGPCTDYYGVDLYRKDRRINYYGIEMNQDWKEIHENIVLKGSDTFNINYIDAFMFLSDPFRYLKKYIPNIIIVNYMISDMLKADADVDDFIDKLAENLFDHLPKNTFVIINDYNRGVDDYDPRYYYSRIENAMWANNDIRVAKLHFKHRFRYSHYYGKNHTENDILFTVPKFCQKFNPWTFCSSAQLVINKV